MKAIGPLHHLIAFQECVISSPESEIARYFFGHEDHRFQAGQT